MQEFYIAREGQAYGPVNLDETNRMVLEGKIDTTTLIWDQRSGTWALASEHPIVARIFQKHVSNVSPNAAVSGPVAGAAPGSSIESGASHGASTNEAEAQKLAAELADLRKKITSARADFQKENDKLSADLAARRAEVEKINKELSAATDAAKKKEAVTAEIAGLEKDLAARRAELKAADEKLLQSKKLNEDIASRGKDLERVTADVVARRKELELVNADIESSVVERNELAGSLEKDRAALAGSKAESEAAARELSDRRIGLQNEIISLDEEVALRRKNLDDLASGCAERSAEFERTGTSLDTIRREIEANETRLSTIREEVSTIELRLEEIERLKAERTVIDKDIAAVRSELEKFRMQRNAHDAEIKLVSERLSMIRAETADLEEKRLLAQAMLGEQVSNAFENIKSTLADMRSMTAVWTEAREADAETRREGLSVITEITDRLRSRESDIAGLIEKLGEEARVDAELAAARAAVEETRSRAEEIKTELKSITVLCYEESERLAEYRREREEIRTQIVTEEARIFELLAEKTSLASEIADKTGQLATHSVDLRSLQCEVDALKRERGVHEGAIEELRRLRGNVLDSYLQVESDLANFTSQATAAQARIAEMEQQNLSLEEAISVRRSELEALEQEKESAIEAARSLREENEAIARSAQEARHEVEVALEATLRELSETKVHVDRAHAEIDEMNVLKSASVRELARLKEETTIAGDRTALAKNEWESFHARLETLQTAVIEKESLLGRLRETESELTARRARLEAERVELERRREESERTAGAARDRLGVLEAELTSMERERAMRGAADLRDLRDMLRLKEARERENLDRLLADARVEFQQLREDWSTEERAGVTNDELRKVRTEVEDKRREMTKMERQLAAMRAGLAKLREENGRTLLQRVQSFEQQQLEDLRRRLTEARSEQEALDQEWGKEMKSGELVDRQWFEIKDAEKPQ